MTESNQQSTTVVIVGAGQAGGELATVLRQLGHAGRIVLLGEEAHVPYRRPPLSKAFLSGDVTLESLYLKAREVYEKNEIECLTGRRVIGIDRARHEVALADGERIGYGRLALATGSRVRRLALPGTDRPNVHHVRTIDDIVRLKAQFSPGARLAIIGGGYIGLEAASVAVKKGLRVTLLEALPRVLARVTAPEISAFYERVHREHGVDLRTGVGVQGFEAGEKVTALQLSDGSRLGCDLVVVGIGIIPNTELAAAAGLEVDNGIVVDAYMRTSDVEIVAIGDCCCHENVFLGRRLRLESAPSAGEQARTAAATLSGKLEPFKAVPWFWSDQYDLKLQMVGLSDGCEQLVIRGDMAQNRFAAFYLRGGVVIAADVVSNPQEFLAAKRLVAERIEVPAASLADLAVPLKSWLPAAAKPA